MTRVGPKSLKMLPAAPKPLEMGLIGSELNNEVERAKKRIIDSLYGKKTPQFNRYVLSKGSPQKSLNTSIISNKPSNIKSIVAKSPERPYKYIKKKSASPSTLRLSVDRAKASIEGKELEIRVEDVESLQMFSDLEIQKKAIDDAIA